VHLGLQRVFNRNVKKFSINLLLSLLVGTNRGNHSTAEVVSGQRKGMTRAGQIENLDRVVSWPGKAQAERRKQRSKWPRLEGNAKGKARASGFKKDRRTGRIQKWNSKSGRLVAQVFSDSVDRTKYILESYFRAAKGNGRNGGINLINAQHAGKRK